MLRQDTSKGVIASDQTYELYYIANKDLPINPIAENAKDLRKRAVVCDITFGSGGVYSISNEGGKDCSKITVCDPSDCQPVTDGDCNPVEDNPCTIEGYKVSGVAYNKCCYFHALTLIHFII